MTTTRVCTSCSTEKSLTEFYRQEKGRDGYMGQCIACNNARPVTPSKLVYNRAQGRARVILAKRHAEEFQQLVRTEIVKAQAEHDRLAAEAAAKGNHDAQTARIKPGRKREGETSTRLDEERCPHCQTHHAADHQCPGCGDYTPKEPHTPVLLGRPTPAWVLREWAYLNDVPCAPRGPIPRDVIVRYANAHRTVQTG